MRLRLFADSQNCSSVWIATEVDGLKKINVFGAEHAESAIGVSNALEGFREFAELILKVYLSMETKIKGFPLEN